MSNDVIFNVPITESVSGSNFKALTCIDELRVKNVRLNSNIDSAEMQLNFFEGLNAGQFKYSNTYSTFYLNKQTYVTGFLNASYLLAGSSGSKLPALAVASVLTTQDLNVNGNQNIVGNIIASGTIDNVDISVWNEALKSYTGQTADNNSSPNYVSNNFISNGDNLTLVVGKLDTALQNVSGSIAETIDDISFTETDTLQTITDRGNTTTNPIRVNTSGSYFKDTRIDNLHVSGSFVLGDNSTVKTAMLVTNKYIPTTGTWTNGTNTGLSLTLTPGVWQLNVNFLYRGEGPQIFNSYESYFWVEDESSVIGTSIFSNTTYMPEPRYMINKSQSFIVDIPNTVLYKTYTVFGSNAETADITIWIMGNNISGSHMTAVRLR